MMYPRVMHAGPELRPQAEVGGQALALRNLMREIETGKGSSSVAASVCTSGAADGCDRVASSGAGSSACFFSARPTD